MGGLLVWSLAVSDAVEMKLQILTFCTCGEAVDSVGGAINLTNRLGSKSRWPNIGPGGQIYICSGSSCSCIFDRVNPGTQQEGVPHPPFPPPQN